MFPEKDDLTPPGGFVAFRQGDEEEQAGAGRGQRAPWRPVRHTAALVPDEAHEEPAATEGELTREPEPARA